MNRFYFSWIAVAILVAINLGVINGCGQLKYRLSNSPPEKFVPNPIQVTPRKFDAATDGKVWNQVVDTVDDFFRIARQQPVVSRGGMIVDGRLETTYQIGGSIFEPWRKDSTAGFERLQGTFQSIRRRAIVTVRPAVNGSGMISGADDGYAPMIENPGGLAGNVDGYVVEVIVTKDIEDVDRPQGSNAAATSTRHDGTVVRQNERYDDSPITLGWIPLGRDTLLEQRILTQIVERLART